MGRGELRVSFLWLLGEVYVVEVGAEAEAFGV